MSLAKITVTGQVVKAPEKRFTESNLAIASFMLNFGQEGQEKLIRVFSVGKLAEKIADTVKKGQSIIVDGRLQTATKTEAGVERKTTEINAQGIEIVEKSDSSYSADMSSSEETNSDDLIGEEEIPF